MLYSVNLILIIASNNWKIGVNTAALVNRFQTSSVKCWTANFFIHASKGLVIIMDQLKSIYNSPFNYSHSQTYSHPFSDNC